ncbi:MAG: hypothetical protein AAF846_22275 [Chloroflexota bacterium]
MTEFFVLLGILFAQILIIKLFLIPAYNRATETRSERLLRERTKEYNRKNKKGLL